MTEKQQFMKKVTILCDTREQQNAHIITALDGMGIAHESRKLDFGDYSFKVEERDFSLQCVVERKANVNELWGNISADRERFEKEIATMHAVTGSANLIIEHCPDRDFLIDFKVPQKLMQYQGRKVENIGQLIHSTLQSWGSSNRYGLTVHYMRGNAGTASLMLSIFYYYYRNYRELVKPLRSGKNQLYAESN